MGEIKKNKNINKNKNYESKVKKLEKVMLRKVTPVLRPLVFKPIIRQHVQRFCGISNSLKLEFYLRNWDDLYEHRHTKKLEKALKSAISSPLKVSFPCLKITLFEKSNFCPKIQF